VIFVPICSDFEPQVEAEVIMTIQDDNGNTSTDYPLNG